MCVVWGLEKREGLEGLGPSARPSKTQIILCGEVATRAVFGVVLDFGNDFGCIIIGFCVMRFFFVINNWFNCLFIV